MVLRKDWLSGGGQERKDNLEAIGVPFQAGWLKRQTRQPKLLGY
jgi:hypothetical protein